MDFDGMKSGIFRGLICMKFGADQNKNLDLVNSIVFS